MLLTCHFPRNSRAHTYPYRRAPGAPVAELVHHFAALNGLAWAPHSPNHICTIADDRQALIWDITTKAPVSKR
jgi:hypothetical protein